MTDAPHHQAVPRLAARGRQVGALAMKLIRADRLTPEERREFAAAARKKRPGAKYRAEFRMLARRRQIARVSPDHPSELQQLVTTANQVAVEFNGSRDTCVLTSTVRRPTRRQGICRTEWYAVPRYTPLKSRRSYLPLPNMPITDSVAREVLPSQSCEDPAQNFTAKAAPNPPPRN
jgi:hypothetical protein